MRLLKKFFATRQASSAQAIALPDEARQALARRDYAAMQSWLMRQSEKEPTLPFLPQLLDALAEAGYSPHDIAKARLFAHFYAGRYREAIELARAIKCPDDAPDAEVVLLEAFSLYHGGAYDEAWQTLMKWQAQWPHWQQRRDFLNVALLVAHAVAEDRWCKHFLDLARALAPEEAVNALNGYIIYFEMGEMEAFARLEAEIAAGKYDLSQAAMTLALVKLAQGRYREGWRHHEGRYRIKEAGRYINPALLDHPLWQGQALATNQTLLISCEQGLGDTIMMARYFPLLVAGCQGQIVIETQPQALGLLQHNFPALRFIERRHGQLPDCRFDYWLASMSLPYLFATEPDNVPAREGYLQPLPEAYAYWQERLRELADERRPRIGLCWSGSRTHRADRRRSIAAELIFATIASLDAHWITLQKEIPPIPLPANLIDVSEELLTLADTAGLIAALDLVISIDSMPVHLAGALGKTCWLMLPYRYEWRWGLAGEENPWYASVKVIRQKQAGDWPSVLTKIAQTHFPAWHAQWAAQRSQQS